MCTLVNNTTHSTCLVCGNILNAGDFSNLVAEGIEAQYIAHKDRRITRDIDHTLWPIPVSCKFHRIKADVVKCINTRYLSQSLSILCPLSERNFSVSHPTRFIHRNGFFRYIKQSQCTIIRLSVKEFLQNSFKNLFLWSRNRK